MEPFITSLQKRKPSQILCSCQYKRARCKVSSEVSGAALKLQEHRGPSLTLHHRVLMGKQRVWHWCFQAREQAGANGSWRFQTNVMMADIPAIHPQKGKPPFWRRSSWVSTGWWREGGRQERNLICVCVEILWNKMLGQSLLVGLEPQWDSGQFLTYFFFSCLESTSFLDPQSWGGGGVSIAQR